MPAREIVQLAPDGIPQLQVKTEGLKAHRIKVCGVTTPVYGNQLTLSLRLEETSDYFCPSISRASDTSESQTVG